MEESFFNRLKRSSAEIDSQILTMEKRMKVCRNFQSELLQKDLVVVSQDSQSSKFLDRILEHLHSQLLLSSKEFTRNSQNIKEKNVEIRDQGFTKPKVLIILPFKSNAFQIIQDLIQISGIKQIKNKARFLEEYSCPEESDFKDKPLDFIQTFSGNTEDCFRIGIKFSKKQIGLYANFYSSDLIIGSPLGLRMVATQKNKELNFDFLSGIEILVMYKSEILLMQNWEHVLLIFKNLNQIPKSDHGTDFSRIRDWALDGKSKYFRQNIILSKFSTLELNNLMNNYCFNADGMF